MLTLRSTLVACSLVLAACSGGVANPPTPFGGYESPITGDEEPNPSPAAVRESSSSSQGSGGSSDAPKEKEKTPPPATTTPAPAPVTDAGASPG